MANIKSTKMRPPFFPGKANSSSPFKKLSSLGLNRNPSERKNEIDSIAKEHTKVNISDSIKDFARIKKAVDKSSPRDPGSKIMELKAKIKNGTYRVDPEKLAEKIMDAEY